jgi:hypothetical protein
LLVSRAPATLACELHLSGGSPVAVQHGVWELKGPSG